MKKKLFAILLVVALVFSCFAALAACKDPESEAEEYTITFRNYKGRELFSLKTTDGKITRAQVEAQEQKNAAKLNEREKDGFFFVGWWHNILVEGTQETRDGEINYAHKYEDDYDFQAGYDYAPLAGEDEGYTLVGVIGGITNWAGDGSEDTDATWQFTQDETDMWMYYIEDVDLLPGDAFKVKTLGLKWAESGVSLGFPGVGEIVLADGVEESVLKDHLLKGELFVGVDDDNGGFNIAVSQLVVSANVDMTFNFRTKKLDITVNEIETLAEMPVTQWILVGTFPEAEWSATTSEETLIFADEGDGLYTIEHEFTDGLVWRIKTNTGLWAPSYGYTHIARDEIENGTSEEELPEDLFTAGSDSNNIVVNYDCTLAITLDVNEQTISIEVEDITIPAPETIYWESAGYVIVGGFPDANWVKPAASSSKYLFAQDEQNKNIGTWTGDIPKDTSFKVATNISAWTGRINIGWGAYITSIVDGEGKAVTGLFMQEGMDNICTASKCNVTITLDVAAKTIAIVVNSYDPIVTDEPNRDKWSLIGTSAAGWSADVDLTLQENGHHTISGYQLKVGEFKVRKDHAWTTSCGSHNERIQIVSTVDGVSSATAKTYFNFNQDNIKVVTACTVDIDFVFYSASNWTLIITVTAVG